MKTASDVHFKRSGSCRTGASAVVLHSDVNRYKHTMNLPAFRCAFLVHRVFANGHLSDFQQKDVGKGQNIFRLACTA